MKKDLNQEEVRDILAHASAQFEVMQKAAEAAARDFIKARKELENFRDTINKLEGTKTKYLIIPIIHKEWWKRLPFKFSQWRKRVWKNIINAWHGKVN